MNTVWITGARGFIGRHLAKYLSDSGSKVYGIGHGIWSKYEYRVWGLDGWLNGEINATNLSTLLLKSGNPTHVFHLAGGSAVGASIVAPLEDFNRTVVSCARLLDWLRNFAPNVCIVAASSAAVYGSAYDVPISEIDITHPFSPYGHHKLMLEQLCHSYAETYGMRSVIVRLFSVYGPWLRKQILWDLCSRLNSGITELRLRGTGGELRDWTEINDVVRLLEVAAKIEGTGVSVINGGAGVATSVYEIANMVVNAWGGGRTKIVFSGPGRPGDPARLVADSNQLTAMGFEWSVSTADGIRSYVKWFKQDVI